jgi:hypothetical protein
MYFYIVRKLLFFDITLVVALLLKQHLQCIAALVILEIEVLRTIYPGWLQTAILPIPVFK